MNSLQYHLSNKNYIIERMESLKGRYNLRILMGYVDIEDSDLAIQGLTKLGIDNDWCLNIIWSHEEGARYIQSYKSVSKKGPQLIVGENQSNDNFQASLDCLTQIKGINTNNAQDLLIKFGSFAEIVKAPTTTTMLIDGIGQTKIKEMLKVFQTPFFPKDNDEQKKDDLEKNKYKKYTKSSNSHENWNMSSNFNKK
ncbi:excision repair cross-complementing 1 ercc1 [Anaeramoeba flamelloides]|uniref:Excision repair cross-complementing 1 ercc1 n=1 Tax=Anaeramoeba flamelloides TaxID=1746091 RepID=A0AAV7ZV79_9EUKA|nr:excision repair cross-complementing 1 ercc1 [Anaeramoeba flamelloides]